MKTGLLSGLVVAAACGGAANSAFTAEEWAVVQELSPLPDTLPEAPTNQYADDPAAAELGQMFFFEGDLSGPLVEASHLGEVGDISQVRCASCHTPENWFSDIREGRTSIGAARPVRNNMTLVNSVFNDFVYWTGARDSFWMHATEELVERESMNGNRLAIAHVVFDQYRSEYEAIFGALDDALDPAHEQADRFPPQGNPVESGEPDGPWESMTQADQDAATLIMVNVGKSLEAYERLLVSRNAPFDRFVAGEEGSISEAAKRGLGLFIGKAACINCHSGPHFNDNEFHNLGLPQLASVEWAVPEEDLGWLEGLEDLLGSEFNSNGSWSDNQNSGKIDELVVSEELRGQFRTQSLRQVAETRPYMHAGQYETLLEVVEFYNMGGEESDFIGTKDEDVIELNLSDAEMADIVSFMETLTGDLVPGHLLVDISK